MSKKSDHLNLCVKNSGAVSFNTLDYTIKAKNSFQKIPGQPPKNIYRVSNLAATSDLQKAVVKGDIKQVNKLLIRAVDLSRKLPNGHTPLSYSVKASNLEMAKFLLANGADPNIPDKEGGTPLYYSVKVSNLEMAKFLLANGADPNIPDKKGYTPLYWAVAISKSKEMTTLLLDNRAHPDIMKVGSEALSLYWAVHISKNKEMTKLLVEKGANLNFYSKYYSQSYLLSEAVKADSKDDVKFFVKHGSFVDIEILNANNFLEYALINVHKEMAAIILQNMSDKNISDPSKGTLLDPILDKIILHWFIDHKESEKINNIQLLSDLLEVFTVDNPNLNDKGVLFGSNTLRLLEKLYNLYLCSNTRGNENIPGSRIINIIDFGIKKLFNKTLENQEEIHDVQADPVQEMLKHNFKGFIYKFIQVVPITTEVWEKYPLINELYIDSGPRNLKSARKNIVPPEQSPEFAKTLLADVPTVHNDQAQVSNGMSLSGQQDPLLEND